LLLKRFKQELKKKKDSLSHSSNEVKIRSPGSYIQKGMDKR